MEGWGGERKGGEGPSLTVGLEPPLPICSDVHISCSIEIMDKPTMLS